MTYISYEIIKLYLSYIINANLLNFLLAPGHCGITGDERAEVITKEKANNLHQQHY